MAIWTPALLTHALYIPSMWLVRLAQGPQEARVILSGSARNSGKHLTGLNTFALGTPKRPLPNQPKKGKTAAVGEKYVLE